MQIKFLTLGFISAAVFSNAVFAHGSVANVEDTHVKVQNLVADVLNNLNAKGLLKHTNLDAASHIASHGGDHRLDRRRLHDALRRREWERDENEADEEEEDENEADEEEEDENEPDEEEEDEDEEDEDENEPDEEEEDEDEPDEDEADESSVAKVARRSVDEEAVDATAEEEEETEEEEEEMTGDENEEEEEEEMTEDEEQEEGEEQDQDNVMMARRGIPGADVVGGLVGGSKSNTNGRSKGGAGVGGLVQTATGAFGGVSGVAPLPL